MKDRVLQKLLDAELIRQRKTINLIASENIASSDILSVNGSALTNKYSEGYPGKRYYPGNEKYDAIELLARKRLLALFHLDPHEWHVNVQPYSGSPANIAIYFSLMNLGEVLIGMQLSAGGHLTHGHRVNFSGLAYKAVQYGLDASTGLIDYEDLKRLTELYQPKVVVSGTTSYPRQVDFNIIGKLARRAGAFHVADISHVAGLVVAGLYSSPFPDSDVVMLTTHKTMRGPRGAVIICRQELADRIDRGIFPSLQGGPHNHTIAAIALMAYEAQQASFMQYQKQVIRNARVLADELLKHGFDLVTGGTDTHLILINLSLCNIDGKTAEQHLAKAGILVNRNSISGDTTPLKPSGIRLGSPAVTTRGMKEPEMRLIAQWMKDLLMQKKKPDVIRKKVEALCKKFPLPY